MDINYWDNMSNPFCEASIIIIITIIIIIIIMIMFQLFNLVGGFNPSEKYESQLGWLYIPNTWKVIKFMFQTTNQ